MFKKLKLKLFNWLFKDQLEELKDNVVKSKILQNRWECIFANMDISVDVDMNTHFRARSWAVISIQGKSHDFIKFVDLGDRELYEISKFLRQFDRGNIDASPSQTRVLRMESGLKR